MSTGMHGLSVRWPTDGTGPEVAQQLRDYVRETSLQRFSGMPGLRFKTWRMVEGEFFEGVYVWETAEARDEFAATHSAHAGDSPVTRIVGRLPLGHEPFEVVGVAEGAAGFAAGPGPGPRPV